MKRVPASRLVQTATVDLGDVDLSTRKERKQKKTPKRKGKSRPPYVPPEGICETCGHLMRHHWHDGACFHAEDSIHGWNQGHFCKCADRPDRARALHKALIRLQKQAGSIR